MSGPERAAPAGPRRVFLRDMVLMGKVGIYPHEHGAAQRLRINVDLLVHDDGGEGLDAADRLDRVVDYERVAKAVRAIVAAGHVKLVETLAERIAAAALADGRVLRARVRVEKLDVFPDALSAGVEVERHRTA